jgi:hypothetical protein
MAQDQNEYNDYIFLSCAENFTQNFTLGNFTGWFYIELIIGNNTRMKFWMEDLPMVSGATGFNSSFFYVYSLIGKTASGPRAIHDNNYRWNPLEVLEYNSANNSFHDWCHFAPYFSFQLNPYYYTRNNAPSPDKNNEKHKGETNWYRVGMFLGGILLIMAGSIVTLVCPPAGLLMIGVGIGMTITSLSDKLWNGLSGAVSDALNWAYDKLAALGNFIWKVGQSIAGLIIKFAETLVYFGSIVLGIILFILAFIVLFIPMYFTLKLAMAFRKAVFGDIEGSANEIRGLVNTTQGAVSKVRGVI